MRKLILPLVILTLAAASCTPSADEPAPTTSTLPPTSTTQATTTTTQPPDGFGGHVTVGVDHALDTLNPFASNGFGVREIGGALWATVYDIDPATWERIPDAVVSLPSQSGAIELNDDGTMTVRYEVQSGAMWSDGIPISGEDIAFTAEAMRDMAQSGGANNVDPIMATVVSTDAVEQIAFVTFAEPTLAFEDALWLILPSHALTGVDLINGTDGTDWPSGGPFVVTQFARSSELQLERNPLYWKRDANDRPLPFLDTLSFVQSREPGLPASDSLSTTARFAAGSVDVTVVPFGTDHLASVNLQVDKGAELQQRGSSIIEHLTFNFGEERLDGNPASANASLEFRRALAGAIDRPSLLEQTGVPWFPETPGMLIPTGTSAWSVYEVSIQAIPELPEGATSVLSTTGNGDFRIRIGDALASPFSAAGVAYDTLYLDSVLFFGEVLSEGRFDVGMWAWVSDGGYASQLGMMEILDPQSSAPDGNFSRWGTGSSDSEGAARFSELVTEAKATLDPVRFAEIVTEAEAILATELPLIPLFMRGSNLALWPDAVTGVDHNGSTSGLAWNVEAWKRVGE